MIKPYEGKYFIWIKTIAIVVVCLFLLSDIIWAQPDLAKSTLSPQSRLKPFFEKHGLEFQNIATIVMAASELKDLVISKEAREGAIYTKIEALNKLFKNGEIEIEKQIKTATFECSGKEYKYAVFHFKKENKTIKVLFFEDHSNLTPAELSELRIQDIEKHHLHCPGLEGVWFINPTSQAIKTKPVSYPMLEQGGAMGRWKYTHTTLADNGTLTLHNATRIPRKDGVVEGEFLIDGQNKPRDIALRTRKLTDVEMERVSTIRQELGINAELRVIARDDSSVHNRIYGVAVQEGLSRAEIELKLSSLKDMTIEAVKTMARNGKADIRPVIELARLICPSFDARIPENKWASITPEIFIILNSALKYQVYLPNNEIFEIVRISERPDTIRGKVKNGSWNEQNYLRSKIWIADSLPAEGGYSVGGLTVGWFAVFNADDFRKVGKLRYENLKQSTFKPAGIYSSPYEVVMIPLIQLANVSEEDFVEGIFVEHARQEEIKHAQDNSYVAQRLRKDNRYDTDEDEQTISEILRPDSTLHRRVLDHLNQQPVSSEIAAKLNRQLGSRIITEYSARLGGAIAEIRKHTANEREELAFIAFLNFMEDQFLCATPEQMPEDDILKLAYLNVAVLFFQDIDEWANVTLNYNSIDVIRMLGMEPGKLPLKKALRMLEEIYAKHFWTDRERYDRLSPEPFELTSPQARGITTQGISFVREDIIAKGNQDQIKEALDHESRELTTQTHGNIRKDQYQGNLRSLITQLSDKDKYGKEAQGVHTENLKYAPTDNITEKTIICEVITDSTVPIGQRDMINNIGQYMDKSGKNYIERVARLKDDGADKFMDNLSDVIARQERLNPGCDIEYYVACARQGDVEAILENVPNLERKFGRKLKIRAITFEPPETGVNAVQVEGIMLALRALRKGPESLREAYKFLTGKDMREMGIDTSDLIKMMKQALFKAPPVKIGINEVAELNRLIEKYIKAAA